MGDRNSPSCAKPWSRGVAIVPRAVCKKIALISFIFILFNFEPGLGALHTFHTAIFAAEHFNTLTKAFVLKEDGFGALF